MPDEEPMVEEEWVYIGRRFNGPKIAHAYLDDNDKELWYAIAPPLAGVGARYTVEVTRTEDSIKALIKDAKYRGPSNRDHDLVRQWRLEDAATVTRQQQELAAKRYAKDSRDLEDITLGEVRQTMAKQPSHIRRGTLAAVTEYLLRGEMS